MRKLLLLALILSFASCKSRKLTADSPQRFVLEDLAKISSSQDLNRIYPNANKKEGTDLFEEGTVERAYTILFPDTPNEILITWNDPNRSTIHSLRVEEPGDWKSRKGIRIGTTYEELVKMNGPLKFYGFGWDYSGAVDWNNGKFSDTNIRVFLAPKNTPPNKFYGDRIIEASEEEIDALDLSVQAIMYQKPE